MHKMTVVEMGMLRWIYGKTKKARIKNNNNNKHFMEHLGVTSIEEKLRETCLRWFKHVQHMLATAPLGKSFSLQVDGQPRKRGLPNRTWMEVLGMINMKIRNISKDLN